MVTHSGTPAAISAHLNEVGDRQSSDQDLIRGMIARNGWQDPRSALGYFFQWLHADSVRTKPEPASVHPRFRDTLVRWVTAEDMTT